jgi:molecular chaperone DnaJ
MPSETLYAVLRTLPTATADELRSAYRQLALRYHPDVSEAPKEVAERLFIAIQEAYEVLSDPIKRAMYDSSLAAQSALQASSQTVRRPVSSSNLRSVGYDQRGMVLEIEFLNGSVYQYFAVPLTAYESLMSSPSKGRFFNQYIQPRFPFQRVG